MLFRSWRVFDQEGKGQCDIISMDDEVINPEEPIEIITMDPDAFDKVKTIIPCHVERILVPHILNGELAIDLPDIHAKKEYIKEQLQYRAWESELRPATPHVHYVDMTHKVAECREEMYQKFHGGSL